MDLFPWMSAGENIHAGIEAEDIPKRDKKELKEIAVNMIKAVGLDESSIQEASERTVWWYEAEMCNRTGI